MSDLQRIGDSLMVIRIRQPNGNGPIVLRDKFLQKDSCGSWWNEISRDEYNAARAELDKVPS